MSVNNIVRDPVRNVWTVQTVIVSSAKMIENKAISECEKVYGWAKPSISNFVNAIDVGCREGFFARALGKDFTHTYCFDFRDKRKQFNQFVGYPNRFTYNVVALGESERTAFTTSHTVGRIKESGDVSVVVRTLDSFNITDVGFIKYDIEGFEYKAIQGSERTIKSSWPVIVVEQNKGNMDAVHLLESWGYKCLDAFPPRNHDFLCVKE